MEKRIASAVMAMALLAGCGGVGLRSGGAGDDGGVSAQGLTVDLRVRATGAEQFESLLLVAEEVKVRVDGTEVAVTRASDLVNLADATHAERIASFELPELAQEVEVEIRLGAAGGYEAQYLSGWIDSRGRVLRFSATAENLALKNKATLVLDATKSLVAVDEASFALVPKFRVQF